VNIVGYLWKNLLSFSVLFCFLAAALFPAFAGEVTDRTAYIDCLQEKLLQVYFPPRGPFNFAGSTIKVRVEANGKVVLDKIVQPPVVHGKHSSQADLCLKSAVQNVNPLQKPPSDMKLPASFLVKFIRQVGGKTVFKCVVQPL
jgi:hypothetical protein